MKYKILLGGKNNLIIDDFFDHMDGEFDVYTTSIRYRDIVNHLEIIQPDLFVYCPHNETMDDYKRLIEVKRKLTKQNVEFVIIGDKDECDALQRETNNMAELVLTKPITAAIIRAEIDDYMSQLESVKEDARKLQEELAQKEKEERRKHILVIDDDPRQLNIIKEFLYEKYDIATAISGKIAYRFLEKKRTDLILLDYEMPGENGPEVLQHLRENHDIAGIPVIFLTGTTDREKIKQALALKPQGYLLKPVDQDKLIGNIEKFLGE